MMKTQMLLWKTIEGNIEGWRLGLGFSYFILDLLPVMGLKVDGASVNTGVHNIVGVLM